MLHENDWLNIKNKVFIVTGGSSGIGSAIVDELLDDGAKVVNADLNDDKREAPNYLWV
ncbi:MAG: SDR family NAD(P)-dependent oxidoreductase, partial [Lactobacillus sp.]|nr:SDR family NAD(P)-dependent oxidoreductase [Lactobacillus sp.]